MMKILKGLYHRHERTLAPGYTATCGATRYHLIEIYASHWLTDKKEGKSSNGRHETYFKGLLIAPQVLVSHANYHYVKSVHNKRLLTSFSKYSFRALIFGYNKKFGAYG